MASGTGRSEDPPAPHLAVQLRDLVEEDTAVQLIEDAAVVLDDAADVLDDAIGLSGAGGEVRGNSSETPAEPPSRA